MIKLTDCKKYYKQLPHQKAAVEYLGGLLLKTPARLKLGLTKPDSWIKKSYEQLEWLQKQISDRTLNKFTELWRADKVLSPKKQVEYYSQRDNLILPYTSCNSSSHAMFVDFILENVYGDKDGLANDNEYVKRVYSGKYGTYGKNNSVSWDIQIRVVKSFGINAKYNNKGKKALIAELEKGLVAPTNFRHKGSLYHSYGGHVVLAVDYHPKKGFLLYDPYGERMPDYRNTKSGVYWMSNQEFDRRWQGLFTQYLGRA